MFNRVVLGGIRWIMGNANLNAQVICQLLKVLLKDVISGAITPTPIAQQQNGRRLWIVNLTMVCPPMVDRITGKLSGVPAGPNLDIPFVLLKVIQPMGDGYSFGQRLPVMVVDSNGLSVVAVPLPIKWTYPFLFFVSILMIGLSVVSYAFRNRSMFSNCSLRWGWAPVVRVLLIRRRR